MSLEELRKEWSEYEAYQRENNQDTLRYTTFFNEFIVDFNKSLSDEEYTCLKNAHQTIENIRQTKGNLTEKNIINLTASFLGKISENLQKKFLDYASDSISISEEYDKSGCYYYKKIVNDKVEYYSKIRLKKTGTLYDVFVLVHEYFHSLTDVSDYKDKISLSKQSIDIIQETISILGELACAKSLEKDYPQETLNYLYWRIYEEMYSKIGSYRLLMKYATELQKVESIEQLQEKFYLPEIIDVVERKILPISPNHILGTISSVELLHSKNMEEIFSLLKAIYTKVDNQEIESVADDFPKQINSHKFAEIVKVELTSSNYKNTQ